MACSLGFLEFLTFLYRYKNSDKPRTLILLNSRRYAGFFSNWTTSPTDRYVEIKPVSNLFATGSFRRADDLHLNWHTQPAKAPRVNYTALQTRPPFS